MPMLIVPRPGKSQECEAFFQFDVAMQQFNRHLPTA
jgi:hypothetical protein